jgi:hypothetical protein
MIKITGQTETIFAQAVALAQNGRMKSTIHAYGNEIFILNMDNTILLRFDSPQNFPEPISFYANDYESPEMGIENGQVFFNQYQGNYARKKLCSKPVETFQNVKEKWAKFSPDKSYPIALTSDLVGLTEDGLSHIEFVNSDSGVKLIQKNIYDGTRVELEKADSDRGFLTEQVPEAGLPLGLRTTDFKALFALVPDVTFFVQPENYIHFADPKNILTGILSTCIYDELGYISAVKE